MRVVTRPENNLHGDLFSRLDREEEMEDGEVTDDDDDEGEVKAAADLNKAGLGKAKPTVEQQPELSMADASLASSLMSKDDHRKYAEMLRHTETAKELTTGLTTNAFVFFFFFGDWTKKRAERIQYRTAALLFSLGQRRVYGRETPSPNGCVYFSKETEICSELRKRPNITQNSFKTVNT